MAELYMYYTVLYRKISGLRRRYNTNYIVMTNYTRGPLNQTVSHRSISYSDPALPEIREESRPFVQVFPTLFFALAVWHPLSYSALS